MIFHSAKKASFIKYSKTKKKERREHANKRHNGTHKTLVEMGLDDIATDLMKVILNPTNSCDMRTSSMNGDCVLSRQRKSRERRQGKELAGLGWLFWATQPSYVVGYSDYRLNSNWGWRMNSGILSNTQPNTPFGDCFPHCSTCQNSLKTSHRFCLLCLNSSTEQHDGEGELERGLG